MEYVYRTQGTCSTNIELNVEDGVVKEVAFWGGCNGNLQGLSRLVKGMKVEEVIKKLEGVRCSGRPTSCPDQLCHALHEMGKNDTEFEHDGVKIVYKNGKWDYDNASDLRYWPTEALDFYAFNPGTVSEDMMVFYSWEATKDVQKISYTCMDEYGSGTTHANYDVMYAMAKGQTKDMNNGIVKFNFKHILSQVVFKAKTQYDNMQVDIDVIKIHNFKFAGAFTLPAAADGTGSWSSSDLAFPHAFTVVKNANITVNSNTEATDITTNTPMLNIPQELTAWKVSETATKSKLEADNAKQCYLEIACKIRQSGAYLLGSASEYKTIYVPFGDTWEQGKRHIYTLIFGGGYDDQGEAVLNPIQFDAETTGWVDADKDVNVQP